jgi:surfactin synthase thioesterase subunit
MHKPDSMQKKEVNLEFGNAHEKTETLSTGISFGGMIIFEISHHIRGQMFEDPSHQISGKIRYNYVMYAKLPPNHRWSLTRHDRRVFAHPLHQLI